MKKWATELNRDFSKEKSPSGYKTHEKMFNISGHKGNANETTLRFHLPPVRIKNTKQQ
jgi:hypothetical protein